MTTLQPGDRVEFKKNDITLEGIIKSVQGDQIEIDDNTIRPQCRMAFCPGKYQPGQYCRACPGVEWCKEKR